MSCMIGAHSPREQRCLVVERIGGNGSQSPMMALLFAGYAVGDWPESRRVRRWVCPTPIERDKLPALPRAFAVTRSVADLKALIAFNAIWPKDDPGSDECTWVDLERFWIGKRREATAARGLKIKPPTCPILQSLGELFVESHRQQESGRIVASRVKPLQRAVDAVLPNLVASCWHAKLDRIRNVIAAAASAGRGAFISVG